jgi:sec-independent protein translocase protein TatA
MGLENPLHIAILVILLLLVFGARRVPRMARELGSGLREFKDGLIGSAKGEAALTQGAAPAAAPPAALVQEAAAPEARAALSEPAQQS